MIYQWCGFDMIYQYVGLASVWETRCMAAAAAGIYFRGPQLVLDAYKTEMSDSFSDGEHHDSCNWSHVVTTIAPSQLFWQLD